MEKTSHTRGGTGRKINCGGIPIDEWGLTAHGLIAAITTLEAFKLGVKIKNSHKSRWISPMNLKNHMQHIV